MVHLIMPDTEHKSFKMGRGHESDLRVSDISVSRCHAVIKFNSENNSFYLEDNLSKFGTLVLANSAIELEINQTRAI
jgi:pSer/pThr/pTyr-binding forkhead associated (FHA) protein